MKLLFIFLPFISLAQWVAIPTSQYLDEMDKIQLDAKFQSSYSYLCHYSFIDQITSDTLEEAEGYLIYNSKKDLLNFQQVNYTGIQNKEVLVLCDTMNRQLLIQKPTISLLGNQDLLDIPKDLQNQYQVKKCAVKETVQYEITLPKGGPYSMMRMTINSKNLEILNYQLVCAETVAQDPYDEDKKVLPIMSINFRNYEYGQKVEQKRCTQPLDYFTDANLQIASSKYADFEIIDLRNNK
jgi:hypothetical protein